MSLAYWCVLIAALLPYAFVGVAKFRPDYNNRNPRAWASKSNDYLVQRAYAAHLNAFEAFAPFAAGVVLAQLAGVAVSTINTLAAIFIAFRILHGLFYIADKPLLRSVAWMAGIACPLALILLAALRA